MGRLKCNAKSPCPIHDEYLICRNRLIELMKKTSIKKWNESIELWKFGQKKESQFMRLFFINNKCLFLPVMSCQQPRRKAFFCLFECMFNVRPSDFEVYLRSDMPWVHQSWHTVGLCSELLMRLSYIHQAYGYGKNYIPCGGSNSGPSGRESSAITARPGSYPAIFCCCDLCCSGCCCNC